MTTGESILTTEITFLFEKHQNNFPKPTFEKKITAKFQQETVKHTIFYHITSNRHRFSFIEYFCIKYASTPPLLVQQSNQCQF